MNGAFRVVTTPSFEREFRKLARGNNKLLDALQQLIGVLSADPHSRTGRHSIKKLAGLQPGEGNGASGGASIASDTTSSGAKLFFIPSATGRKPTNSRWRATQSIPYGKETICFGIR